MSEDLTLATSLRTARAWTSIALVGDSLVEGSHIQLLGLEECLA